MEMDSHFIAKYRQGLPLDRNSLIVHTLIAAELIP